ncbi:uncharacterized protein V1513DRAFT_457983 [Lipomyces chichibuensis]|uniref:uncharacterized protein n=1 Tax=Lipomyces chichibuensis TaxID=1546026 RepID=UPI003343C886
MAYQESLDFSTESFLDSVLSEFDKIGLSNATPSIATTAPTMHDPSIPASEQSKEMGGNQERRDSEVDDFELIDLIEAHMTEDGLNIGSVSPSLEAESPLNGSVFENVFPLDGSFRGLTESVGGRGTEQVYGLEKSEREPELGENPGGVVCTGQEIAGGNVDEVEQSSGSALSAAHATVMGTEMASTDTENSTIEEARADQPDMTDALVHREEIPTASQTFAVTIDAEDAVHDITETDGRKSNSSEIDSAAREAAPSMETHTESADSGLDTYEESPTAGVSESTAAVSAMDGDVCIEGVVPIRESDLPVEATVKPEILIPVLDTQELIQGADSSESASADTEDLATTDMSGTKGVEEPSKSGTEVGDGSESALIDLDISDGSPVLATNADECSIETQGLALATQESVPLAEGVTGDELKISAVVGSAADDTGLLELEAVEPGQEGVTEPAKPEAVAETAMDMCAELKGIEFKEKLSAEAPVEKRHASESTTAGEVEPVLDASTDVPIAIDEDSKVYIYTSFTGGGMFGRNIMTATNRLQLILRSNNIGFEIIDVATNEQAKKLWGRSSKGKKLPGIVKGKDIVGNYEDIEEANEFGEVQQLIAEFV